MTKLQGQKNWMYKIHITAFGLFLCFVLFGFYYQPADSKTLESPSENEVSPLMEEGATTESAQARFANFSHAVKQHSRLACSSCHKFPSANWRSVRKKGEAFPDITDYPKHESCLSCHRQQFFGSPKPSICSICHTNPGPRNSSRHAFPNPREVFDKTAKGRQHTSDFAISFPHDKHIEIVSQNESQDATFVNASFDAEKRRAGEESCSVCHQTYQPQGESDDEYVTKAPAKLGDAFWLKKGTFKTSPISHATCFTCHSQESGILPAPTNCATCHKLAKALPKTDFDAKIAASMRGLDKITLTSWRKRDSSATFRHEFSSHADLECASCHNVLTMDTTNFLTKKVPVTSCNMCHITETSDDGGALNLEIDARKKDAKFQCVKCHLSFGKMPIPDSHFKAVAAAAGK